MNVKDLQKYTHPDWEDLAQSRNDKYYFVKIEANELEKASSEIQYQLSVPLPAELEAFYKEAGFGFLWFCLKQKKGLYRILSPEELLDLYFEPDDESMPDDFIMYRENAWDNLEEDKLLAFCLFGEEDSLLYIGLSDGAVYYLSVRHRIADSFTKFLELLDEKVDYFMNV